jgi:glycosyltransferase involved in cell wall biosynthesis
MGMRIAHVTATFPPYSGGTGNVCFENCRDLVRRGHDVHVFTAAGPGLQAQDEVSGIKVHRLRVLLRSGNAPFIPGLFRSLREFDVIHLHYPFFGGELAAFAATWTRTPLVVTYHQDVLLNGPMRLVERVLRETIGRYTLQSAAKVLFTTEDYGYASHVFPMLRNQLDRVSALPNGVDVERFIPTSSRSEVRARLNLPQDKRIALVVARLDRPHYFKGVNIFLRSMKSVAKDIFGVIVGDGNLRPEYEAQARALNLGDRIRFTGQVSDQELPMYYQAADVTVLPSITMGEAFGLVLVESMACGTPVIASNLPGVREVVTAGQTGLLTTPGNPDELGLALNQILANSDLQRRMGQAGRERVLHDLNWQEIGHRLESIYQSLLAKDVPVRLPLVTGED